MNVETEVWTVVVGVELKVQNTRIVCVYFLLNNYAGEHMALY